MALTYSTYLQLDKILDAQAPRSPEEHDELLFIVTHQVYELWFKQLLHEGRFLQTSLEAGRHEPGRATLKRMLTVLKTMVAQTDVLETMTPISFAAFRTRLESASGFQSVQFRLFEYFLGARDPRSATVEAGAGAGGAQLIADALKAPALYDSFLRFLVQRQYKVPAEVLGRDVTQTYRGDARVQELLLTIYREDPLATQVCELLVDLDEGVQEWRYRHVKMVERTIGVKFGTGGSPGVEYLKRTLFRPAFPDLWEIRSRF